MTLSAPFPYFGGKRRAAPIVWSMLGDPAGYVEPFLLTHPGSAAVSDPYADAADLYWQAGWRGILPPALDHLVLVVVSGVVTQAHEFGFNES